MIKHQYAQSDDGSIKNISDVTDECRKDYQFICVGCGIRMTPVLGKIRERHFRHQGDCVSQETFLHKLGKKLFIELYENNKRKKLNLTVDYLQQEKCDEVICPLGRTTICKRNVGLQPFELLPRNTGLRPDVLLSDDSGNEIYVEIFVTHEITEQKKASGIPIVEFHFTKEDDLSLFKFQDNGEITNLGHDFSECYNFDRFVVFGKSFCHELIKIAKNRFKAFYQKRINASLDFKLSFPCSSDLCEKPCNSLLRGRRCRSKETDEYDLTEKFKTVVDKNESAPDLYLVTEKGSRIRVNFSIWQFEENAFSGAERVIQFALSSDGNYYAWELDRVISQDSYVKFFNFNKKLFLNCEEQRYEGAVLYKTGRCVPLVDMNILQIHEIFLERKHAISDYIIIPSEYINPDSWLGAPVNWTGKEIYETICAAFLKNGMWVKNCNLCTFGRKNKKPYEVKPLYCYRHRCACNAGDAMKCEEFQIGDGNVRTLTSDKQLVKIIEKAWKEYRLKG